MLPIITNEKMRAADQATMALQGITSIELMERAATACVEWITERHRSPGEIFGLEQDEPSTLPEICVFAGTGNNGGDALAMARLLIEAGYEVSIYAIRHSENTSSDFHHNLEKLLAMGNDPEFISNPRQLPLIPSGALVIDGIFGSGLNRPATDLAAAAIAHINRSGNDVISIDIPSGLFADKPSAEGSAVVHATHTLCFQTPKRSFMLPGTGEFVGHIHIMDIGLDMEFVTKAADRFYYVDSVEHLISLFKRKKFDHKGKFGHALMMAGSYGKMGAAVLASEAALHSGCGLLTTHIPKAGYAIVQTSLPEAMCSVDEDEKVITTFPNLAAFDALGLGPGIGTDPRTAEAVIALLREVTVPVVVDADALNIIAQTGSEGKELLRSHHLLTPHVGEFDRLFGASANGFERLEKLVDAAKTHRCFILLKGAHSALATPTGEVYFNSTGNPYMAKGGSGDVLTGVITALAAQCGDLKTAAIFGMYLHGCAGDDLLGSGFLPSDLARRVGGVLGYMLSQRG